MCRAFIEAKLIAAIICTTAHPFIAFALTLWKVHYAFSVSLCCRVRTVIEAPLLTAITSNIGIIACTCAIVTYSTLAAVIALLRVKVIDVNED
jgi:hypothetical protein